MKRHSPEGCLTPTIGLLIFLLLAMLIFSCRVAKPVIEKWTVIKINDSTFVAGKGKKRVTFIPVDSVWVGKEITISRGK